MATIGILYPDVKNVQEFFQKQSVLLRDSHIALETLAAENTPEKDLPGLVVRMNAIFVYDELQHYSNKHNGSLCMTWDEIRAAMKSMDMLDDIIKYLLQNGFLKEGFKEIP